MKNPIYEYIGDPVMLIEPDAYTSAAFVCSAHDGLALAGVDTVLVILAVGDAATCTTFTIALNYSCDAEGSNADAGSDEWHSTDAIFVNVTSAGVNETYVLELDCLRKGNVPKDIGGYLFATPGTPTDAVDYAVIAIPIYQNVIRPSTNANTVVYSYGAPDT